MLKMFITNANVSKGFDGAEAIKFSEKGDAVRFRIGCRVYDSKADNNTRWVNLSVKGFGPTLVERIRKMGLKEGSSINLEGRYDEESWDGKDGQKKTAPVLILGDIEFASSGGGKKDKDQPNGGQQYQGQPNGGQQYQGQPNGQFGGQYGQPNGQFGGQYGGQFGGQYGQPNGQFGGQYAPQGQPNGQQAPAPQGQGFTGYEPYGGNSYFG